MSVGSIIVGIIMFVISLACFIISFLQFLEKMPLLNNTYMGSLNKKMYYTQSGIIFLLVALIFVINGIECFLKTNWLFYLVIVVAVIAIIYTITSCIIIGNKNK